MSNLFCLLRFNLFIINNIRRMVNYFFMLKNDFLITNIVNFHIIGPSEHPIISLPNSFHFLFFLAFDISDPFQQTELLECFLSGHGNGCLIIRIDPVQTALKYWDITPILSKSTIKSTLLMERAMCIGVLPFQQGKFRSAFNPIRKEINYGSCF